MLVFRWSKLVDQNRSYDKMSKSRFTLFLLQFLKTNEHLCHPTVQERKIITKAENMFSGEIRDI